MASIGVCTSFPPWETLHVQHLLEEKRKLMYIYSLYPGHIKYKQTGVTQMYGKKGGEERENPKHTQLNVFKTHYNTLLKLSCFNPFRKRCIIYSSC